MIATFLAGSPFIVVERREFMDAMNYQAFWVTHGLPGVTMPYGRKWLLGFALPYAVGTGTAYILLASVAFAFVDFRQRDTRGDGLILAVFPVALASMYLSGYLLYLRYFAPLMPVAALLIARLIVVLARTIISERYAALAATVAISFASVDSLSRAVALDHLLAQTDTRTLARDWIAANLPEGAHIIKSSPPPYSKPPLPPKRQYEEFDTIVPEHSEAKLRNTWIVLDDHPITMFSPPPTPALTHFIETRGTLVAEFDPFVPGAPRPAYEPPDAFYAPLANFSSVTRPGPRIRIYQIDVDPSAATTHTVSEPHEPST